MKGIIHKYDKIIVGATFESLLYSYFTKIPVFYVVPKIPSSFDSLPIGVNFKILKIKTELQDIYTNQGTKLTRPQKQLVWGRLVFLLSMLGLMPSTNLQAIRIEDNIVKLSTKGSKLITLEAKQILLFDDEGVEGLDPPLIENNKYVIKDYVYFNNLKFLDNEFDLIYTDYDVANQIWFTEPESQARLKDGCIISYCNDPNEVTDYAIKFILKEQFKKFNMKGKENGYHLSGLKKHRPVKYTFIQRVVEKEKSNIYQDTEFIKFVNYSIEEIFSMFEKAPYREFMLCTRLMKMSTQRRKSRILQGLSQSQEKH